MNKHERGMMRPVKGEDGTFVNVDPTETHMPGTNGTWKPNSNYPSLLSNTRPLLDRTHTPRGALRAITLERNFAREKWLYNKKDMDEFDTRFSKKDLERSKTLKRLSRRQEKQRTLRETMLSTLRSSTGKNT